MARYQLTIDFDDSLSDDPEGVYAALAASLAIGELERNYGVTVEHAEFIDRERKVDVAGREFNDLLPCEVVDT